MEQFISVLGKIVESDSTSGFIFIFMLCFTVTAVADLVNRKEGHINKFKFVISTLFIVCFISAAVIFIICNIFYEKNIAERAADSIILDILQQAFLDIIVPVIISLIIAWIFGSKIKKHLNFCLVISLILSIIGSNLLLIGNHISANTATPPPAYPLPYDALLDMADKHLQSQHLVLDAGYFSGIVADEFLLKDNADESDSYTQGTQEGGERGDTAVSVAPPETFEDYVYGISGNQFAEGMDIIDYFEGAYQEYSNGNATDPFTIAQFFSEIGDYWDINLNFFSSLFNSKEECYKTALEFYDQAFDSNQFGVSNNKGTIYHSLRDYSTTREMYRQALQYIDGENDNNQYVLYDNFKRLILNDIYNPNINFDEELALINDILLIFPYRNVEYDIQLSTLLGYLCVHTETNVDEAISILSETDLYFNAGHPMTKILLATLKEINGESGTQYAEQLIAREMNGTPLNEIESLHFARYYFAADLYKNAYGYLVTPFNDSALEQDRLSMLAELYLKGELSTVDQDSYNLQTLYDTFNLAISNGSVNEETQTVLKLICSTIGVKLGHISQEQLFNEVSETGITEDTVQYFLAVAAFNKGDYLDTIERLSSIFANQTGADNMPLDEYELRLMYAQACFQYANGFRQESSEWTYYMSLARTECDRFAYSTKNLRYLQEKFNALEQSINIAEGNLTVE